MNYILLYPDELRAESLGCYGHPVVKTPNIDALAAEGTLFEGNYSAHPVCVASRCSLVTGWYPHVSGFRSQRNYASDATPNFWQYLKDAGWTTALIGKDDCFDKVSTDRIFDEHPKYPLDFNVGQDGTLENNYYTMILPPEEDNGDDKPVDRMIANKSIDFINRHAKDENPFCLWVNFLYPHPAYTCPEPWYSMYDGEELPIRGKEWLKGKPDIYELTRQYRHSDSENPSVFRKMNSIYLGMISYVDSLIGEIVQSLRDNGIYDDTTVILCSDHGDFAGDAQLTEKHPNTLDDMLTRVPLIIRRPGAPKNHRVSALSQSIDIFPTVFDYEGLKIRHDQFGVSLRDEVEGSFGNNSRVVYSEGGYDTREPQCFEHVGLPDIAKQIMHEGTVYYPKFEQQEKSPESLCRTVMRRDRNMKIIVRTNGENEMYDMVNDPQEYHNLYLDPSYKGLFMELSFDMLNWLIHTSDVVPQLRESFNVWYSKKE